jgi:Cu/Ag efflux protein CusF
MKAIPLSRLALALLLTAPAASLACDCGKSAKPASSLTTLSTDAKPSEKPAPRKHPLKGIVTDLLPADSALMVKHEEIPGVMKAMTMMLTVDPAVLSRVKKNDAITALLYRDAEGIWRLDDVKVITPLVLRPHT